MKTDREFFINVLMLAAKKEEEVRSFGILRKHRDDRHDRRVAIHALAQSSQTSVYSGHALNAFLDMVVSEPLPFSP